MAIYHFDAKIISRSTGRSSTAAAAYRAGERIQDNRIGKTHNYTRKGGVWASEILAPDHAPDWMRDRSALWNGVEQKERRHDAQVARDILLALPVELNNQQRQALVRGFVQEQFIHMGMVADIAYHEMHHHNPHAHILLTMRQIDGDGFGKKERSWNDRQLITQWRQEWENHVNRALNDADIDLKVDCRSHEAKGDGKVAQVHLGPTASALEKRNISTDLGDYNRKIRANNKELDVFNAVQAEIEQAIDDLKQDTQQEDDTRKGTSKKQASTKPDKQTAPSKQKSAQPAQKGQGRTEQAVQRQIEAMGAGAFVIRLYNRSTGHTVIRKWSREELLQSNRLQWLKRMNAKGYDVLLKPSGNCGLVLVTGLNKSAILRMSQDKCQPAAVIENSPNRYQAWVRVSSESLKAPVAKEIQSILAQKYQDANTTTVNGTYGRLAGFTNHDPSQRKQNRAPYVLAHECQGEVIKNSTSILQQAQANVDRHKLQLNQQGTPNTQISRIALKPGFKSEEQQALVEFWGYYTAYREKFGIPKDIGRVDWMICRALAMDGYQRQSIKHALSFGSADVIRRSNEDFDRYADRVSRRMLTRPEVQHYRQRNSYNYHSLHLEI